MALSSYSSLGMTGEEKMQHKTFIFALMGLVAISAQAKTYLQEITIDINTHKQEYRLGEDHGADDTQKGPLELLVSMATKNNKRLFGDFFRISDDLSLFGPDQGEGHYSAYIEAEQVFFERSSNGRNFIFIYDQETAQAMFELMKNSQLAYRHEHRSFTDSVYVDKPFGKIWVSFDGEDRPVDDDIGNVTCEAIMTLSDDIVPSEKALMEYTLLDDSITEMKPRYSCYMFWNRH